MGWLLKPGFLADHENDAELLVEYFHDRLEFPILKAFYDFVARIESDRLFAVRCLNLFDEFLRIGMEFSGTEEFEAHSFNCRLPLLQPRFDPRQAVFHPLFNFVFADKIAG